MDVITILKHNFHSLPVKQLTRVLLSASIHSEEKPSSFFWLTSKRLVVDRSSYAPDFQFTLRINVKISEHAQNFNVFKPRLVCRRILILPSGSSGNSQKSEILKNLKFSKI